MCVPLLLRCNDQHSITTIRRDLNNVIGRIKPLKTELRFVRGDKETDTYVFDFIALGFF